MLILWYSEKLVKTDNLWAVMRKTFHTFYSYFWRYKGYFIASLVFAFLSSAFNASLPFLYRYLVNDLTALDAKTLLHVLLAFFVSRMGREGLCYTTLPASSSVVMPASALSIASCLSVFIPLVATYSSSAFMGWRSIINVCTVSSK